MCSGDEWVTPVDVVAPESLDAADDVAELAAVSLEPAALVVPLEVTVLAVSVTGAVDVVTAVVVGATPPVAPELALELADTELAPVTPDESELVTPLDVPSVLVSVPPGELLLQAADSDTTPKAVSNTVEVKPMDEGVQAPVYLEDFISSTRCL